MSDEMLASYVERYADMERKHMAFFQLKMVLGPCIETLILLDRLAYVLEQARLTTLYFLNLCIFLVSFQCFVLLIAVGWLTVVIWHEMNIPDDCLSEQLEERSQAANASLPEK